VFTRANPESLLIQYVEVAHPRAADERPIERPDFEYVSGCGHFGQKAWPRGKAVAAAKPAPTGRATGDREQLQRGFEW
jgi:hypothetical protein